MLHCSWQETSTPSCFTTHGTRLLPHRASLAIARDFHTIVPKDSTTALRALPHELSNIETDMVEGHGLDISCMSSLNKITKMFLHLMFSPQSLPPPFNAKPYTSCLHQSFACRLISSFPIIPFDYHISTSNERLFTFHLDHLTSV